MRRLLVRLARTVGPGHPVARWSRAWPRASSSTGPRSAPTDPSGKAAVGRSDAVLRLNEATHEWTAFVANRNERPRQFEPEKRARPKVAAREENCPFCIGNETESAEVDRHGWTDAETQLHSQDPDASAHEHHCPESAWALRVVENKYPVVTPDEALPTTYSGREPNELGRRDVPAFGYHNVIIEHPRHDGALARVSLQSVQRLLSALWTRGRAMRDDDRVKHTVYFKNHGAAAGASLVHPHSQVVGLPVVPFDIQTRVEHATRHAAHTDTCVFCTMLERETHDGRRIVFQNDSVVAFVPYAALSPFQTYIIPRVHAACFLDMPRSIRDDLAEALQCVAKQLYCALDDPDFNMILHSRPFHLPPDVLHADLVDHGYHWFLELFPRLGAGAMAGFEIGSTMFSNSSLPEDDARDLRNAWSPHSPSSS